MFKIVAIFLQRCTIQHFYNRCNHLSAAITCYVTHHFHLCFWTSSTFNFPTAVSTLELHLSLHDCLCSDLASIIMSYLPHAPLLAYFFHPLSQTSDGCSLNSVIVAFNILLVSRPSLSYSYTTFLAAVLLSFRLLSPLFNRICSIIIFVTATNLHLSSPEPHFCWRSVSTVC